MYTKEGRTAALEESMPVFSSGLQAEAVCWKLGFIHGKYYEAEAETLVLFPARTF